MYSEPCQSLLERKSRFAWRSPSADVGRRSVITLMGGRRSSFRGIMSSTPILAIGVKGDHRLLSSHALPQSFWIGFLCRTECKPADCLQRQVLLLESPCQAQGFLMRWPCSFFRGNAWAGWERPCSCGVRSAEARNPGQHLCLTFGFSFFPVPNHHLPNALLFCIQSLPLKFLRWISWSLLPNPCLAGKLRRSYVLVGGGKGIGQENWRMVVGGWWVVGGGGEESATTSVFASVRGLYPEIIPSIIPTKTLCCSMDSIGFHWTM